MFKIIRKFKEKKGFTLIELIVVVAVLGILASIAIPRVGDVTAKAKNAADKAQVRILQEALERYIAESGDENLSKLVDKLDEGSTIENAEKVIKALKEGYGDYGPYLGGDVTTTLPSEKEVKFNGKDKKFE